jgi:hypothetical protein
MGPWGLAAVAIALAGATKEGRQAIRNALIGAVKTGYKLAEKGKDVVAEAKEELSDLVEEVKSEQNHANGGKSSKKVNSNKESRTSD